MLNALAPAKQFATKSQFLSLRRTSAVAFATLDWLTSCILLFIANDFIHIIELAKYVELLSVHFTCRPSHVALDYLFQASLRNVITVVVIASLTITCAFLSLLPSHDLVFQIPSRFVCTLLNAMSLMN